MRTQERTEEVEIYLTNLDNYLIALGVDPRERFGYLEEIVEGLLDSNVDPTEEFGPAEDYARRVAVAGGVRSPDSWRRTILVLVGSGLLLFGVTELLVVLLTPGPELTSEVRIDSPYVASPLFAAFSAWTFFSSTAIKHVVSRIVRLHPLFAYGLLVVAAVFLIGFFELYELYRPSGTPTLAPTFTRPGVVLWSGILAVLSIIGGWALWQSKYLQLWYLLVVNQFPSRSPLGYNPVLPRTVTVRTKGNGSSGLLGKLG